MKSFITLALAMLTCLFGSCLMADSIPDPDPKISLERGGGSTPIGFDSFTFNLDGQGGGIFDFCNNTAFSGSSQFDCAHYGFGQEIAANGVGNSQNQQGLTFYSFDITTEVPLGKTLFTCRGDLFAFCAFALNGDGSISVRFFGTGYFYSDGTASAVAPDLQTSFGSNEALNFFPGITPGDHFALNFNNDPSCVPTPNQPCTGSRNPGASVTVRASTPEPGTWILLVTAGAALAGRKRWADAGRRLTRLAGKFL